MAVLPRRRGAPYGPGVSRTPKHFRIDMMSTEVISPISYRRSGPDTAVPSHFVASFSLGEPEVSGRIEVAVIDDVRPVVIEVAIRSRARDPITTSMLRQVLVDQLLQAAVQKATVPLSEYEDWLKSLPEARTPAPWPREAPAAEPLTAQERVRSRADEDARTAAQLYTEALASGSRAPAMAVVEKMNRSRAQVARYIRRARELGLLAPLS
jgi:hypothetical protein